MNVLGRFARPRSGIAYWEERVRDFGVRAVLNKGHSDDEIDRVTAWQWSVLAPLLTAHLRGNESLALDFGCGYGRFTGRIAAAIEGVVLGVDPIPALIAMADRPPDVAYAVIGNDGIPARDGAFDVVWVCLVLGTIVDDPACERTASELLRVLAPDGLLFVVENTDSRKSPRHVRFRPAAAYAAMFRPADLSIVGQYSDLGEQISVLAGRRAP